MIELEKSFKEIRLPDRSNADAIASKKAGEADDDVDAETAAQACASGASQSLSSPGRLAATSPIEATGEMFSSVPIWESRYYFKISGITHRHSLDGYPQRSPIRVSVSPHPR